MRQFLILIILLPLGTTLQAQNYVGQKSTYITKEHFDTNVYSSPIHHNEIDNSYVEITALCGSMRKAFYLNDGDVCYKYIVIHKNFSNYRQLVRKFNNEHTKLSKHCWKDTNQNGVTIKIDKKDTFYALIYQNNQLNLNNQLVQK